MERLCCLHLLPIERNGRPPKAPSHTFNASEDKLRTASGNLPRLEKRLEEKGHQGTDAARACGVVAIVKHEPAHCWQSNRIRPSFCYGVPGCLVYMKALDPIWKQYEGKAAKN